MKQAIRCLNELATEGIIGRYAIGGAIGASFYIEAANTEDVDAFVLLEPGQSGLITLEPLYAALKAKGGVLRGEHVVIGGWPIQILPAYKPLVEAALSQSIETQFDGEPTRVFAAEYLCAIALDTGRAKDLLRVQMFLEQDAVDMDALRALVAEYSLEERARRVANWTKAPDADHG